MKDTNQYSYCNVVGDTDVGCKRKANEDWYAHFECRNGLVSVVCDGMGGHVGGAVASHLAVETIQMFLESNHFDDPRRAIVEACNAANAAILQRTSQQPELTGMGSTCVMLIVRDGKVYMGSVGDSRIYLVRSKTITQLTKDQSYVQMLVDQGAITKEQAEHHPRKNEITNALGLQSMQPATVLADPINPEAGDCFLLCSDGLSGMVSDNEILKVTSNQTAMTQRERVAELIQRARKHGGLDNITCLIVEFATAPNPGINSSGIPHRILFRYVVPAVAVLLLVAAGLLWWHLHKDKDQHSDYVNQMSRTQGVRPIIDTHDTIFVKAGTTFATIEEHQGLGTRVYITDYKGNTDTITLQGTEYVRIVPDSIFKPPLVAGSKTFVFNGKMTSSPDISLTFKKADSTIVYVFPVKNRQEFKRIITRDNQQAIQPTKEEKKPGTIEETMYYGDHEVKKVLRGDIAVNRKGEKHIVLYAKEGPQTNDEFYTGCCPITPGQQSNEWYSYNSDGATCHITIYNDKVPPENAQIEIPLKNNCEGESFVINVSVQN